MTDAIHPDDADRQALLELLLAEEGLAQASAAPIPPRDSDAEPVLSYAQERLWFLQQFESDTAALAIRTAVRIHGGLDVEALRRSLDALVARHASLRTLITAVGGEPKPIVLDAAAMPLVTDDLRGADDPDARLAEILDAEAQRTFELDREPPIVARLVALADDEHVLSIVVHHVASDGWSVRVLFNDLSELYAADVERRAPSLPALPVDYADYAAWQRTFVSGENLDRQLEYWKKQLAGPLPVCEIPTDYQRPPMHTFDGGQVEQALDPAVAAGVRALAAAHGATPFMVLLAAFDIIVARHMDHDDVIVGTPVAGRVRPELEGMIGMFLNTLVLRTDVGGDPTFAALIERVRDVSLGAYDHQDVSFEHLLAELQPPRDLSRSPLFQVFFNMLNFGDAHVRPLSGLHHELVAQPELGSKFDLTMYIGDDDGTFDLLMVYNRGLYRSDTMRQLLDQYVQLIEAVVADPTQPISRYSLVTPEAVGVLPDESQPLDATWHGSVPAAVCTAAERAPTHPAVVDPATTWSYADLARHMDRLGTWLVSEGIGKGDVVAIYGHRSASLVAAVTGALGAGAAYVLLDPRYPTERLVRYLQIARPRAWLAVAAAGEPPGEVVAALDAAGVAARRVVADLSALESSGAQLPDPAALAELAARRDAIGPDDLACLTFTSGSTGDPKAVMGRHGSLTHFLPWQTERFGVTADDRFSMLSGLAHDPIQRDMFWALWVGATIVAPDPDEIGTPGWLAEWLRRERITIAHLTPAMGQLIAEGATAGRSVEPVRSLRRAFFIGDVLTRRDAEQFRLLAPEVLVVNLYGTTETQRASGHHVVDPDRDLVEQGDRRPRQVLPLGHGIPGTQLLVRSDSGGPAGFGEVGEIWFRSHHLALGYHDRPEDTAASFYEHPPGRNAVRCYRTGDRGRYLPDGEVEFMGRGDDQIQLRGFRVELGEVRAALVAMPDVDDAVVRALQARGVTEMVGYVVPATDAFDVRELRRSLRTRLPAHMVPTDFVVIDAIPLTPNGKIDVAALPDPEDALDVALSTEPRDELERRLVGWWEDVLGRSGVGIHDNFFDLGGYSLLATRLFAMIEAQTGQRVAVSALFQAPTVAELADVLRGDEAPAPWSSLVPVQPKGSQLPLFYVAPYMISVLQFAHLGDELGDDQPLYGLQPQGLDGALPVHTTIEEMAAHYIREMREVQPHGPYRIGGHCSGTWVAFEMARQLEAAGERIDTLLLVDQGPPDSGRPPIKLWSYLAGRVRFYFRDGRLRYAISWQTRIIIDALLLRRVGTQTSRYTEEVRATHRSAYQVYLGGVVDSDIVLIRSDESLALADKFWYLRWDQKTTGEFHHTQTSGTHANLLERPYVEELAERMRWAFGLARTARDEV